MTSAVSRPFPTDFLWGVATAGHQNEGNNTTSDTWFLENVSPTIFAERSGRACNTWELWPVDLDLAAGMGLNAFRFSTEWARIEPARGDFDAVALDHYEAVVDGCLERGLAPAVTFSHFTSPHWFAAGGAWLDADAPELFARFCDRVMARVGRKSSRSSGRRSGRQRPPPACSATARAMSCSVRTSRACARA